MDVIALAVGAVLAYSGYRILAGLKLALRPSLKPEHSVGERDMSRVMGLFPATFPPYFDVAFNRFLKMFAGITLLVAGLFLAAYGVGL